VMLADGFLDGVDAMARSLWPRLADMVERYPGVLAEVRGMGLMIGLKCIVEKTVLCTKLREKGMLTVGAGDNVIRLVPPLTIDESHVDEALAILDESCRELKEEAAE